jgi:hypothetical protein
MAVWSVLANSFARYARTKASRIICEASRLNPTTSLRLCSLLLLSSVATVDVIVPSLRSAYRRIGSLLGILKVGSEAKWLLNQRA